MICAPLAPEEGALEHAARKKAEAIAARRAARPAWRNAHFDRLARDQEARRTSKEYRKALRDAEGTKWCPGCEQTLPLGTFLVLKDGRRKPRCKSCLNTASRAYYHRSQGRTGTSGKPRGTVSPERRSEIAERIAHLTALLNGTSPQERIDSQQGWDMTTSELQRLWVQSGDKECVSCRADVPPTAMLPPTPANFYTGKCRSCARAEYEAHQLRVFGKVSALPLIPMRDGSNITLAEFARRVRARELDGRISS